MDDLTKRLSWAITTHANDDTSRPRTPERNRFCLRSTAMIDARDYIQEHAARIAATEGASVVKCCTNDCNQGRTCPMRVRRRMTIKPLVMEILAAIAMGKKDER